MSKDKIPSDYYAGLAGLEFNPLDEWDEYELGDGLVIRPTFAHLIGSYLMAFGKPKSHGGHHAEPWRATSRQVGFDISTELFIPGTYKSKLTPHETARVIVCMLRLYVNPEIRLLVRSSHSLSSVSKLEDDDITIVPIEDSQRFIELSFLDSTNSIGRIYWIRNNWKNAVELMTSHADFKLAMEAFEMSAFIPHHALTLVSLWGALEALFSPSTSELRFRVSVLIASYIHPPGIERAKAQKEIADLYDKRSAAAHGKPKHDTHHLLQTYNILRKVLIRMIEENEVPSKNALNNMLLGVE